MHKTLKTMISHFVHDKFADWDEVLPYCLLAYRNLPHEATKESPFFLMFGRDMELPIHLSIKQDAVKFDLDENYASEMLARFRTAHEIAHKNIATSVQQRCTKHNKARLRKELQPGDLVYLNNPAILGSKIVAPKFRPKWTGPYRVIEKRGPVTYKIKETKGKKEHVVHAERLKPCKIDHTVTPININLNKENEDSEESDDEYTQQNIEEYIIHGRQENPNENPIPLEQENTEEEEEEYDYTDSLDSTSSEELQPEINIQKRTRTREIRMPEKYKDFKLE
jgi:hypothetical protein